MDIPEEVRDDLESRANVVGTAWGPKRVSNQTVGEDSIIVLVTRKVPEAQLDPADRIPDEVEIAGTRVKTDVQEVGDVRAQATAVRPTADPDRERRWRPAPAGVSFGHPEITAGTLGSPPLETEDGRTVVLTNAHVAAPIGAAAPGDDVLQPGPADGGTDDDAIGTLAEAAEIAKDEPNATDSALVEVDPANVTDRILGVGTFAGFTEPRMDATYTKSGRTTGVTTGDLRARDTRIRVGGYYDEPTVFEGVDVFGPMSAAGDSGSLIGIAAGGFHATHLLFAGSDRATIAVPMDAVEDEHGELAVFAGDGGDGDAGDGGGAPGGGGFVDSVGQHLRAAYGEDAVTTGGDVDFRVSSAVQLVVAVATDASEVTAAAGRALAAADSGAVPVLAYPESVESPAVERLGHRMALLPIEIS